MSKARKTGIILILIGIFLPTVTLPFISEFHPLPDVCLTSNYFRNMGNMEIVFRPEKSIVTDNTVGTGVQGKIAFPYKYLFSSGVILFLAGIGVVILSGSNKGITKH